ncbi:MAG: hydrogenase maturation protease, partial [Acidobacteriota bacterium]
MDVIPGRARRVLVAGIGNIFFGDDGFGVEVVRRLAGAASRPDVTIADYGIRGLHLAYALLDGGYDRVIFVDALPQRDSPGTLVAMVPDPAIADGPP